MILSDYPKRRQYYKCVENYTSCSLTLAINYAPRVISYTPGMTHSIVASIMIFIYDHNMFIVQATASKKFFLHIRFIYMSDSAVQCEQENSLHKSWFILVLLCFHCQQSFIDSLLFLNRQDSYIFNSCPNIKLQNWSMKLMC